MKRLTDCQTCQRSISAPACTGIPSPSAFQLPGKWAAKLAGSWTSQRLGPPSAPCANALITTTLMRLKAWKTPPVKTWPAGFGTGCSPHCHSYLPSKSGKPAPLAVSIGATELTLKQISLKTHFNQLAGSTCSSVRLLGSGVRPFVISCLLAMNSFGLPTQSAAMSLSSRR